MAQSLQPSVSYPDLNTPDAAPGRTGALKGKVALIAGFGNGLSGVVALELAARGARVAVNYHQADVEAEASQVVDAINNMSPGSVLLTAILVKADPSSPEGAEFLFQSTLDAFRTIDIVVSTASREIHDKLIQTDREKRDRHYRLTANTGYISNVTEAEIDSSALNLKGHALVAQQAYLKINVGGRLVFTSGIGTQDLRSGSQWLFKSGRAAVAALVSSLSIEFRDKMVTVNGVASCFVRDDNSPEPTERFLPASGEMMAGNTEAYISRFSPMNRMGLPEDIARVIAFLVSEDGARVNGQNITTTGGYPVH